jgi:hypothetical protein
VEFNHQHAKSLLEELLRISAELQEMTGRKFTLDGHLVGSFGEVLAKNAYGLVLEKSQSEKACDAKDANGRRIEIKATFGKSVAFRHHDADCEAELCIVLKLKEDATFAEIYNGPMERIINELEKRKLQNNGQRRISLTQLEVLNKQVDEKDRLRQIEQIVERPLKP